MILKKNNFWLGVVLGVLSPIFILLSYYYAKFAPIDFFWLYFELLLTDPQFIKEIASGFLMINGFVFFAYVNTNKFHTGFGLFITTVILGMTTFLINVFFAG